MKKQKKQENKKTNEKKIEIKLAHTGTTIFGKPSFMRDNQTIKTNK